MAHRLDSMTQHWGKFAAGLLLGSVIAYACTTETAIGPDVALDSLYIEPASSAIVLDDTLRLTAIGVDTSGRHFAYALATWSTTSPEIDLTPDGAVIALATGTATVTAMAGTKTAMAMMTISPKPIFATSRDSVPFTGIANGPDPAAEIVTITNSGGGTLVPSVDSIDFGPGASGWLQAVIAGGAGTDTLHLTATTTLLAIGNYSAAVFLSAPKATPKTITVTLAVTADAPFSIAIDSGDAQTATVNSAVSIRPAVLVRDQYSNPVASAAVTFQVTGGGGAVLPATTVSTDAAGRARVTSWTLGTGAGPNTLQASVASLTPVSFSATGIADAPAATAKTAGDVQSATVNTGVSALPTLRVMDQFGNPVESVTVVFAVATGGGSLTGGTKKTDGAGFAAVGSWKLGTVAGPNTLTATATALPAATFSATGTADVADSIKLSAGDNQTDTVRATLATPYAVRVADQYGNGVPGQTVTWGVSGGGSITPTSVSNASGIATATRVFGNTAGPQGATASIAGVTGSPVNFNATATHGAAATIVKFAGDNQSATAGSPVSVAPSARVNDAYGNPVPGIGVTFAVTAGGGSVAPTTAITTNAAGTATVTTWTLGPGAGSNNNTLTASATGLSSVGFLASGLSGAAQNLLYVSGNAQTDTIGASLAAYTVRVTDVNSNGVQGVTITWQVTAGGGSITPSSVTDVNGFATATRVLGTSVGVDSATASVGVPNGSPQRFGATALPGNPSQIFKIAGDGQSATVNTTVTTAPRIQITDRAGNPIASANVTFTIGTASGSIVPASPAALATDGSGFAQLTSWTLSTSASTDSVRVTSSGTPGATFYATSTPDAPSASQSSVLDNAVSVTACSVSCTVAASTADSVTVTVRDQFNNLISGASVTISSTGTGNAFSPSASGTSNASGVFAAKLNSTVAQAKTISATAGGTPITQTATVTVNATAASTAFSSVAASASPITACQAGCSLGSTALTLTATVRDSFNNVINGAAVTLASNGTNNYFNTVLQNSVSGSSSGAGTYSATFNSGTAQLKSLSATITSGAVIGENTSATINAAAPFSVSVLNQGFSARVGFGVGTLPTYTVRDAFSNVVPSFAISYSSSNSGAFTGPGATNASGQVTLTSWTMSGVAGDDGFGRMANQVTVTAGSASGTATDYGIYTYSGDASPILSGCDGCHYINWTRANIVGQPDQNPAGYTACSGYTLVTAGNANASLIYLKTAPNPGQPCGGAMPAAAGLNAATRKILRAWINNGALNN